MLVLYPLTLEERDRLAELAETSLVGEVVRQRSGKALQEMRDRLLYREAQASLECWAQDTCRTRMYQLIQFADVQAAAAAQSIEVGNEHLARALGGVPPSNCQMVTDVPGATTSKTNPSSADIHGVADTDRKMLKRLTVGHLGIGELRPYTELPPEHRALS